MKTLSAALALLRLNRLKPIIEPKLTHYAKPTDHR